MMLPAWTALVLCLPVQEPNATPPEEKGPKSTREALLPLQSLIGSWKCAGIPEEGMKGAEAWEEEVDWSYEIEKEEYSLHADFKDGKFFKDARLVYDLKKKIYRFIGTRNDGRTSVLEGKREERTLLLETPPPESDPSPDMLERLTLNLLRNNRHLMSVEERPKDRKDWTSIASYGCTKKGVPFVRGNAQHECLVTGGIATMSLEYQEATYWFC